MKSAKNLLIPFIVMILLAIGVVVFFVVDRGLKMRTAETTYATVDLLYINPVEISSVSVQHRDGGINVKVDRTQNANGTVVYNYSGSDKGSGVYSQSHMESFLTTMSSFVSCRVIADNANFADYGLDAPLYTVTITKTDGTQKVILIGNNELNGSGCYVTAEGSASVYLGGSDKLYMALKTGNDFLDDRLLEKDIKDLESVTFTRKKDSVDLTGDCIHDESSDTHSFKFTKPFEIGSSTYFDKLIENICSMSAVGYEDATTENLSKYGLGVPRVSIFLRFKGGVTYTVDLSSAAGGFYYGRINGTGKIFKVESSKLEISEAPILKLISEYVFYTTCDTVDSIECSGNRGRFVLKLEVKKDRAISDSDSKVSLDGRNAKVTNGSGRSYAAMLYESIFCLNVGGIEENAIIPETAVADTTIKVYDHYHSAVVYEFYRRSDDSFYLKKNGEYTGFYVFKRGLYNDGGTDTYSYGIWPAYEILTKAITNGINGVYEIPVESENK